MNRRDILKGIAALPSLGIVNHASNTVYSVERKAPRNLLQVGFTSSHIESFAPGNPEKLDAVLKAKGLIPEDAVLEAIFDLATQDAYVYRWRHSDFHPVCRFDVIETRAVSEDWLKVLACG